MDLEKTLFPTEKPRHSSKWISGKELMERWGRMEFELFDFMRQGLQGYTFHGKKIIDSDSLERAPRHTLEQTESLIRGASGTYRVLGRPGIFRKPPTEEEIKAEAIKAYEAQPLKIVNLPKNCKPISFTIPEDEKKAEEVILKAMSFLFKMEDILNFEDEHGLAFQEPQEHGLLSQEIQEHEMVFPEPKADPNLSEVPSSQDDSGIDVQKYIGKRLADGVPKEKIAVELYEKYKLSYFKIGQLLAHEGLNAQQYDAIKQRGKRLCEKGLGLITEKKRGKKPKKR